MKLKIISALVVLFTSLSAQSYDADFGVWNGLFLNKTIDSSFSLYLETQTRLHEGSNTVSVRSNRFLLRPAVRYSFSETFHAMFGYGWTPNFTPYRGENRIWQQLQHQSQISLLWNQLYRLRIEQRWIDNTDGTAFRVRLMTRFDHWFDAQKTLGLSLWNEVFMAVNSVTKGPQSGFDQNRTFIGPMIGFTPSARLECGYINVFVNPTTPSNKTLIHALGLFLFANL